MKTYRFKRNGLIHQPSFACSFQQGVGADDVRLHKGTRVEDGAVYVRFGSKMNHRINLVFCENVIN